jgi:hypothetical protein
MSRRVVRVEIGRRSAILAGPRVVAALELTGARWHWHESSRHRAVRVHPDDLDDVLVALETDGQHVHVLDRYGDPLPFGGLLGGPA